MNNDLKQFSEERLKELAEMCESKALGFPASHAESAALARIALSVKQAKPVANVSDDDYQEIYWTKYGQSLDVGYGTDLYATPQPAHTEQDGWIKCSEQLPDDDSFVLVTNGKHTGMGAYLRDDHLEDDERWQDEHFDFINKQSKYSVTHWMSLPKPPVAAPKPESE